MKTLGSRLKKARERSNLKQIDASKKLGISNGTLSGYERDYRDPDTATLEKMSQLYDVSVDWLLGRSDNPKLAIDYSEEELEQIFNNPDRILKIDDRVLTTPERRRLWEILKATTKKYEDDEDER